MVKMTSFHPWEVQLEGCVSLNMDEMQKAVSVKDAGVVCVSYCFCIYSEVWRWFYLE